MRLQATSYSCGPCAIANALEATGAESPPEEGLIKLCKTSPTNGTSPAGIIKGLEALGHKAAKIVTKNEEIAWAVVVGLLGIGRPLILIVDKGEHWVTGIGMCGDRVLVADGADGAVVLSYDRQQLVERWANDGQFFLIEVLRAE